MRGTNSFVDVVRKPSVAFGILLVLSLVLVGLVSATQSVWLDESLSISFSLKSVGHIVHLSAVSDLHPPLYNVFLHFSGVLLGNHIWWYRFWSVLAFGFTAILLWWYFGKKGFERHKKVLYAFLFLSSPFALYYASEARSYMLVVLVSLIQFISFDLLCAGERRKILWWVYGIASLIGVYLFYPLVFSLIAHFVYILWKKRKLFWKFFVPWSIVTLLYLPWIIKVLFARIAEAPGHFLAIPWWQIPAIIFVGFSGGRVAITDVHHLHWFWPTIVVSVAYLLAFLGIWRAFSQHKESIIRLGVVFAVPILIGLGISAIRFSVFDPRYYAEVFILFLLLLIYSLDSLWQKPSLRTWGVVGILLIANALIGGLYLFSPDFGREQWKEAVGTLESQLQPGDVEVFIGYDQPPPAYTFYQTKDVPIISTYTKEVPEGDWGKAVDRLSEKIHGAQRVWFSEFLEWQKDPQHILRNVIEEDFRYVKTIGRFKVQFDLYERK